MKSLPNTREIKAIVNSFTVDVPEDEISDIVSDIESLIEDVYEFGHDKGIEDGRDEYESENPPINQEEVGVNYAVEQFTDCKTLSDFQDKLKEITLRSYNFQ